MSDPTFSDIDFKNIMVWDWTSLIIQFQVNFSIDAFLFWPLVENPFDMVVGYSETVCLGESVI